jgi:hypothetical protein
MLPLGRRLLVEGKMRAVVVIVGDVFAEQPAEVALAQDDDVVE